MAFGFVCAIPIFFGWGAYEVLIVFSSYTGAVNSAAFVVGMQLDYFAYSCAYGIQIATVALIGFEIGAGNIEEAKRIAKYLLLHILIISFGVAFLIWIFAYSVISAFTPNSDIHNAFL